ncbi:MAG: prepilin peptidase [Terracidiphilus sp.]
MRILGTIFAGLLGLAFGSFLNVCLSRWPAGESVVRPRSHCRQCGRTLTWWENVPLISWLALRGRCRTCRAWIGWRYPLVELAVGALWAISMWQISEQFQVSEIANQLGIVPLHIGFIPLIGTMFFLWLLVGIAVLDAEHFWIADAITLPGIALGIAFSILTVSVMQMPFREFPKFWISLGIRLLEILAAAGLILLIRWLYWLIRRREGIGLGDAKLMALLAAWLGLPGALLAFGIGIVLGALAAVIVLVVPSTRRGSETWAMSKLPLGTFLCIGGIVSSLWGQPILAVYLRWAGL